MKKTKIIFALLLPLFMVSGCDKKNDDVVIPLSDSEFPQIILLDDEGDGDLEDADEFGFTLTLAERPDPSGKELSGTVVPLEQDVTVLFEISEWEGFSQPSEYISNAYAMYEVDDCTTSEDMGIDLNLLFDAATGKGSVIFPKGITEMEVVFETDDAYFDDDELNEEERSVSFVITGVEGNSSGITWNKAQSFKYEVLDNEGIHGDWELDHENPAAFAAFQSLFGLVNEEVLDLEADEVEKIEISIEYDELKVLIELKETEMIESCDGPEEEHKVIEIEMDLAELETLTDAGEIELEGEIEMEDGSIGEYAYAGSFSINGGVLELTLSGEYDEEETEEITLTLNK